jgi:hypothetical protein
MNDFLKKIYDSELTLFFNNRVFQYFLNYAKKYYGQDWIDKYVHTFYAVGAPFLGATKLLRALVSGERLGLDYFLSTSEALKFARTLGMLHKISIFFINVDRFPF